MIPFWLLWLVVIIVSFSATITLWQLVRCLAAWCEKQQWHANELDYGGSECLVHGQCAECDRHVAIRRKYERLIDDDFGE